MMDPQQDLTRREFVHRAAALGVAAVAGSAVAQWLQAAALRGVALAQDLFARITGLPPEITPTDRFYVVSKNPPGFDPRLDAGKSSLEIAGKVGRPVRLSYDDIRAMPAVEQVQTLECISNEVGGDLISTARWKGVPLRDLLAKAGHAAPTAVKVAFRCADGYSESVPIADAMRPTSLLVYGMNGQPLPPAHGFPLRLLLPGLYGMKNPKWITKIDVVDYDFQGYWQASGWSDEAVVKTMSRFDVAAQASGGDVALGGVAFAGDRGIASVEYSTDNGKTWHPAAIKPALGLFTWVLWAAVWKPSAGGTYTLKVRAKDSGGVMQTSVYSPTLPDGASGYHTLRIQVRKPAG